MKMINKVNTLKQLREEKVRLKVKEEFLSKMIKESVKVKSFGENFNVNELVESFATNPNKVMSLGTMALPEGRLKNVFQTLSKFSWLIPLILKYRKRLFN